MHKFDINDKYEEWTDLLTCKSHIEGKACTKRELSVLVTDVYQN